MEFHRRIRPEVTTLSDHVPPGGASRREPHRGPSATATSGSGSVDRSGVWLSVLLGLATNLATLAGVAFWGWPAGNVFLIFWIENVVLGLWTIPKIITARGGGATMPLKINGVDRTVSSSGAALFFCLHYGLFCVVHLVFTGLVAWRLGVELSFWFLGFPALLIVVRYSVEALTTWFGRSHRRELVTPAQAMREPYPRIIVLQLAAIICFGLFVSGRGAWVDTVSGIRDALTPWLMRLSPDLGGNGVFAVLVLTLVKMIVDVAVTARVLRPRA